tara:strand:+ start:161 stop:388 length:228 start_codon:yes stop_codon:yes gene_type:complete
MLKYILNLVKRLVLKYVPTKVSVISVDSKAVTMPKFTGNARQRRTARRKYEFDRDMDAFLEEGLLEIVDEPELEW